MSDSNIFERLAGSDVIGVNILSCMSSPLLTDHGFSGQPGEKRGERQHVNAHSSCLILFSTPFTNVSHCVSSMYSLLRIAFATSTVVAIDEDLTHTRPLTPTATCKRK